MSVVAAKETGIVIRVTEISVRQELQVHRFDQGVYPAELAFGPTPETEIVGLVMSGHEYLRGSIEYPTDLELVSASDLKAAEERAEEARKSAAKELLKSLDMFCELPAREALRRFRSQLLEMAEIEGSAIDSNSPDD